MCFKVESYVEIKAIKLISPTIASHVQPYPLKRYHRRLKYWTLQTHRSFLPNLYLTLELPIQSSQPNGGRIERNPTNKPPHGNVI